MRVLRIHNNAVLMGTSGANCESNRKALREIFDRLSSDVPLSRISRVRTHIDQTVPATVRIGRDQL